MRLAEMFLVLALGLWVYNLFRILKTDAIVRRHGAQVPLISTVLKVVTVAAIAFHIIWLARLHDTLNNPPADVRGSSDMVER